MSTDSHDKFDPSEDTGVADVRAVRNKIAAQYAGDLQKHVAETNRIVEPLIKKLGLKEGTPTRHDDRQSGAAG
jgi:hypothetical protein